jgi:hypothetical protein
MMMSNASSASACVSAESSAREMKGFSAWLSFGDVGGAVADMGVELA